MTLLAIAGIGHAGDSDGQFVTYGERACWDYIVWMDTGNAAELDKFGNWIAGFVTAYNRQTPDTFSIIVEKDLNVAFRWLAQWCRANPKSKVSAGMSALTDDYYPRRLRTTKEATK